MDEWLWMQRHLEHGSMVESSKTDHHGLGVQTGCARLGAMSDETTDVNLTLAATPSTNSSLRDRQEMKSALANVCLLYSISNPMMYSISNAMSNAVIRNKS
uniref:G_PROTEIN_RECEP_F1_2 domain-containing protein n=1 Tax=Steinernema glaseri TaxID=37863 RepID=A0A1I7ZW18_9BILA